MYPIHITDLTLGDGQGHPIPVSATDGSITVLETLQINPSAVSLKPGETQAFTLTPNVTATWTLLKGDGTLSSDGLYTAPIPITVVHTATVSAKDTLGREASAIVTLEPPPCSPGDVDSNGKLDVNDAILALRFIVGAQVPTPAQKGCADIVSGGTLDVTDVIKILRKVVGLDK